MNNHSVNKGEMNMKINYIGDFKKWEEDFSFFVEVPVRFSETDMYGHLNNTVPFTYFEYARIEYFKNRKITSWSNPNSESIVVVADLQCDFLKQIYFDEKLKVYVKAATVGNTSLDLHYMVKNEKGEICLTGRGRIVQINKNTGKPMPWNGEQKEMLNKK